MIEPASDSSPRAFEPIDPEKASRDEILARLREAGIRAGALQLTPLADALEHPTVVVLATDQEPGVAVAAQALADRAGDVVRACDLLGRAAGARRLLLAVPDGTAASVAGTGTRVLPLPPNYPESLAPLVARRAGDGAAAVVPLETALAALDAVAEGRVQASKLVTLVWTGHAPAENLRVALGTRLADVVAACDLEVRERDKLVAGGPMRGFAQYSLDATVDEGVDAIVLTRAEDVIPYTDNPCINCGACIDVCPARLQVQLIGRYSEFGKFDPVRDLGIDACVECGLCATVCTGRRPLMQLIRLAKHQIEASRPQDPADTEADGDG
jgi:electron transport complex protein RnfC